MDELPWQCSACGAENMVDFTHLLKWPVDQVLSQVGFVCNQCAAREAIAYTNASLDEAVRKLARYSPQSAKFQYLFAKLIRRVETVQGRGEVHGAFQGPHMASS